MKIGILTHYNVSSHGALLQMYALQKELEDMGHDVYILTYTTNMDFASVETKKRFSASLKNIPYYLMSYISESGIGSLYFQYKKQRVLKTFRNGNFKMIPYTDSDKLDCVVVGADEVFALENGLDFMMFGHGITSPKIIAYAPSSGQTDAKLIEHYGCIDLVRSGLLKFSALSARDKGTKNMVDSLMSIDSTPIVCDPAILHNFGNKTYDIAVREKYIVVYSYQSNFKEQKRIDVIKSYAKVNGLKLYSVGVYFSWCDKQVICDPLQMIEVFSRATAIITDTFHGTIASYIARTPMAVFVRNNNNVKLDYLLEVMGITDRKVSRLDDLDSILKKPLDFCAVDARVIKLRDFAKQYLTSSLDCN